MKRLIAPLIIAALFMGQSLYSQITVNISNTDNMGVISTSTSASGMFNIDLSGGRNLTWGGLDGTFSTSGKIYFNGLSGDFSLFYNRDIVTGLGSITGATADFSAATIGSITITGVDLGSGWNPMQNWANFAQSPANQSIQTVGILITSNLTAIPEPSTYAAILGGLALCFIGYRRFRAAKA